MTPSHVVYTHEIWVEVWRQEVGQYDENRTVKPEVLTDPVLSKGRQYFLVVRQLQKMTNVSNVSTYCSVDLRNTVLHYSASRHTKDDVRSGLTETATFREKCPRVLPGGAEDRSRHVLSLLRHGQIVSLGKSCHVILVWIKTVRRKG